MPDNHKPLSGREKIALTIASIATVIAGGASIAQEPAPQLEAATLNRTPVAYQTYVAESASGSTSASAAPRVVAAQPLVRTAIPTRQPLQFRPMTQSEAAPVQLRRPQPPAQVDWKAARAKSDTQKRERKAAPTAMSRLPKAEMDRTRLPVLLPRDGGVVKTEKTKMMSFGDAYAMNMPQDKGINITVYGNRSIVKGERGAVTAKGFARVQGVVEDVQITRLEDGWTATFSRYGVVYNVDILCNPEQAECQTDAFIRTAIADMDEVAIGAQAEAEADAQLAPTGNWFDKAVTTVTDTVKNIGGGN